MTARLPAITFSLIVLALAGAAPALAAPANDNFASATDLGNATSVNISGTNVAATTETGESTCCSVDKTVWYKWTAPKTANYRLDLCASDFNTFARVGKGTAVNNVEEVAVDDDDPGCGPDGSRSRKAFVGFAGQQYYLQIGSKASPSTAAGNITGTLSLVGPANDFFADSTTVDATSGTLGGTNTDATTESGEATCCSLDKSVWYHWTAPKTGNYRISLCDSTFNTFLRVSKGTAVNTLETVVENDDSAGCGSDGSRSSATFIGSAGQRYEIQVGSKQDTSPGTVAGSIRLVSPANDFFADATPLTGATTTFSGTNVDATMETGEPTFPVSASVWYRWTPPTTGSYKVTTCGSSFNSYLRILKGTAVSALETVAENDDSPDCGAASDDASVTFAGAAGTSYSIQVASAAEPRGTIAGTIAPAAATTPPGTTQPVTFNADGSSPVPTAPLKTTKDKKHRKIVKIRVKGKLGIPAGTSAAQACTGSVAIKVTTKVGKKAKKVGSGSTKVKPTCAYSKTITVLRKKIKHKQVKVKLTFAGNAAVAKSTFSQTVRVK